jgi:uncharacterized protein with von Willebrand factor type A (vWA) domain
MFFGMRRSSSADHHQALAAVGAVQQQGVHLAGGIGDAAADAAAAAAAGALANAPPGVQARPEWVLQTAPGWLQLLAACLKQLTQQQLTQQQQQQQQGDELGLSAEQVVLLQQEWLPAWEQLLMLIGAAVQLQQQQGEEGMQQQQQQQQLLAVQAAVQAVHAVSMILKVSVGGDDLY